MSIATKLIPFRALSMPVRHVSNITSMRGASTEETLEFWTYKCTGCGLVMNWDLEGYPNGPSVKDLEKCFQCGTPIDQRNLKQTSLPGNKQADGYSNTPDSPTSK